MNDLLPSVKNHKQIIHKVIEVNEKSFITEVFRGIGHPFINNLI